MMKKHLALAAAAGLPLAGVAFAQNLYLESTQDVALLSDSVNNPGFFVGNNPSAIALVGDSLFVAGFNNTGVTASGQVVKIENIFGERVFRTIPTSVTSLPAFRGFTGMAYTSNFGLLVSFDAGGVGTAGSIRRYDVDTQLNPILVTAAPAGLSPRGGAGPAWDYGFNAQGFVRMDINSFNCGTGQTVADGPINFTDPVAAIVEFAGYGCGGGAPFANSVQQQGPFGVDSTTFDMLNDRVYDASAVNASGGVASPRTAVAGNGGSLSGTFYRDIDVHPTTGLVAVRANNDLAIVNRGANNGNDFSNPNITNGLILVDGGDAPFVNGQNVSILWGMPGGDVVAYNFRDNGAAGQAFAGKIRFVNTDGTPAATQLLNADGSTFDAALGNGYYDLFWDGQNQRLAIADFNNRQIYIFGVDQPSTCPACAADFDQSGGVDGDDIAAFFNDWQAGAPCGDVDGSGGVDGDDIPFFFARWEAGGCN